MFGTIVDGVKGVAAAAGMDTEEAPAEAAGGAKRPSDIEGVVADIDARAKTGELLSVIIRVGQYPASEDTLLTRALQLIDSGANPAFPAVLHYTAETGSLKALRLILDNGGRMNLQHPLGSEDSEDGQRTPLMHARDPKIVRALLEERADPNHYVSSKGGKLTPLLVAVRCRTLPAARVLLEAGADPHVRDGLALKDAKKYADQVPEMAALVERYMYT